MLQVLFHIKWQWYELQQAQEPYRVISGIGLFVFVVLEWHLLVMRVKNKMRHTIHAYRFHKYLGVVAPLAFYIHSTRFGYGYLSLLTTLFFANILVGLFNPEIFIHRPKWYSYNWMIVHIMLAVLMLALVFFHIYVVLIYE